MFKNTLTAASSTYNLATTTAVQPLILALGGNAPTGDHTLGDQIASVDVVSSGTGAAATIALILVDPNATDTKIRIVEATVTPTAQRAVSDGSASGGYVCTVAFPDTTNKVDLIGGGFTVQDASATGAASGAKPSNAKWYVGCSNLGGLTSLVVNVSPTRAI